MNKWIFAMWCLILTLLYDAFMLYMWSLQEKGPTIGEAVIVVGFSLLLLGSTAFAFWVGTLNFVERSDEKGEDENQKE